MVGLPDSIPISDTNTSDASKMSPVPPIPPAASINQFPIADRAGLRASEGNVPIESERGAHESYSLDVGEGVRISRMDIC